MIDHDQAREQTLERRPESTQPASPIRASVARISEDARRWQEEFSDFEREAALWNYART
jgi:hypothetical protein